MFNTLFPNKNQLIKITMKQIQTDEYLEHIICHIWPCPNLYGNKANPERPPGVCNSAGLTPAVEDRVPH